MHTAMQLLFIAISLWVIYGALRYGGSQQIRVIGVFASDGTRLDRPASVSRSISVTGPGDVSITESGIVITARGPGVCRVQMRG
ncbi:MAG: hypothetical protein JSS86_25530 [Cyanobacteria bacterium SZAS LIN-2]|nr:hypothetical protein [Cyanobacteria bacterium SZAS LIN-2]